MTAVVTSCVDFMLKVIGATGTESVAPPVALEVTDPPPRLFALVIGINKYQSPRVTRLKGAVPDANDFETFLKDSLRVPVGQIRSLRDEQATRKAIVEAFLGLRDDSNINQGDAIVIYYAGHGGETKAPDGWESEGGKTQYILPVDIKTTDSDGKEIFGIPDRTIAAFINKLAKVKGDNISVFFDCCHSGSGTRTDEVDLTRIARIVELDDNVPSDLDKGIWQEGESRGASIPAGFAQTGLRSHVLLAACSAKELSMEHDGRGDFTKNFLTTLRGIGADKVTYKEMLNRMPALPSQNPQCEGVNQGRVLFNGRAPSVGRVFYKVSKDGPRYVLEAGMAHGITDGAEFTIYKEAGSPSTSTALGVLVAKDIKPFKSSLAQREGTSSVVSIDGTAYAIMTKAGAKEDLRVFVDPDERLTNVFQALAQQMQNSSTDIRRIQLVEKDQNPHFHIGFDEGAVYFEHLDPIITKYGLTRMPPTVNNNVDDIYPVIRAAAHFKWHVDLANVKPTPLQTKVEVHFMELREKEDEFDDDLNPIYEVGKNLNVAGEVYINEDSTKMYAIKLVNNTDRDLYPSLFYFDNSTFEILSFYEPPTSGQFKLDAPLQAKSSLTIGYGSGGHAPRNFSLPDGRDVDLGFLKLFLSTEYIDYSYVPQPSPFNRDRGAGEAQKKVQVWDSIKVAVIQKKGLVMDN